MTAQFRHLVEVGERVIGKKMSPDRLSEVLALSQRGSQLWKQVLATAKHAPAPLTFFDGTILMAPIVVLRGTAICVEFYEQLLAELQELISRNEGTVPHEKVRIYWEGMPVWGRLRSLSELFAENHAAVVASTYCNSWVFDAFDTGEPLRSMAMAYTEIFINRGEESKLAMLIRLAQDFRIDGMVFHDAKTCFNNSNNRFGLPRRFREATGIPAITIDGDLNDLRFFSDGQTGTKLETFIEQLAT